MGNNIKRFEELEIQDDFISVIMRNRCVQDLELPLKDDTVKIILNTKGILDYNVPYKVDTVKKKVVPYKMYTVAA